MKFQDTSIHRLKVKKKVVRTHGHTDTRTHGQAQSNMPYQLFQSWGHKNVFICWHGKRNTNILNTVGYQIHEDGDINHKIERLSRNLCYKIHTKRLSI